LFEDNVQLNTLAHDALTDIDHPLHPGKKGIDMYLGMKSVIMP
jgi:hypothetical protein